MISFVLPEPPAGNHRNCMTRDGRVYPSATYKAYRQRAGYILRALGKPEFPQGARLGFKVRIWHKDKRKRDADGVIKGSWDLIQEIWGIDDFDYWHLEVTRMGVKPPEGRLEIMIWELHDDE